MGSTVSLHLRDPSSERPTTKQPSREPIRFSFSCACLSDPSYDPTDDDQVASRAMQDNDVSASATILRASATPSPALTSTPNVEIDVEIDLDDVPIPRTGGQQQSLSASNPDPKPGMTAPPPVKPVVKERRGRP